MNEAPPRAFYRWELPEDSRPVDFHLNLIELLERDAIWAEGKLAAGVLLGRVGSQRSQALAVEHYDRITPEAGATISPFGDAGLVERSVNRWRAAQTRMKPVGFYRTCARGAAVLTEEDLAAARTAFGGNNGRPQKVGESSNGSSSNGNSDGAIDPECIFLLIEPGDDRIPSKAVLFLLQHGDVVSQSASVVFSRHGLTNRRASGRARAPEARNAAVPFERKVVVEPEAPVREGRAEEDLPIRNEYETADVEPVEEVVSGFTLSRKHYALAGAVALAILLIAGIVELTGSSKNGASPRSQVLESSELTLKLQRVGNDLQLSWNPNASAIMGAVSGKLFITDGSIQKTVSLDVSDLHSGSLIYSPITNDIVMKLEVEGDGTAGAVSESVRMVEGLPTPLPASAALEGTSTANVPIQSEQMTVVGKVPNSDGTRRIVNTSAIRDANEVRGLHEELPSQAHQSSVKLERNSAMGEQTSRNAASVGISGTKTAKSTEVGKTAPASDPNTTRRPVAALLQPAPVEKIPVISASHGTSNTPFAMASVPASTAGAVPGSVESVQNGSYSRMRKGGAIEPAQLILQQNPVYPVGAKQMRISGSVEVHFKIGINGHVHDVRAVSGPNILAQAAVEAVEARQYKPSLVEGVPTETDASAVFLFKLY